MTPHTISAIGFYLASLYAAGCPSGWAPDYTFQNPCPVYQGLGRDVVSGADYIWIHWRKSADDGACELRSIYSDAVLAWMSFDLDNPAQRQHWEMSNWEIMHSRFCSPAAQDLDTTCPPGEQPDYSAQPRTMNPANGWWITWSGNGTQRNPYTLPGEGSTSPNKWWPNGPTNYLRGEWHRDVSGPVFCSRKCTGPAQGEQDYTLACPFGWFLRQASDFQPAACVRAGKDAFQPDGMSVAAKQQISAATGDDYCVRTRPLILLRRVAPLDHVLPVVPPGPFPTNIEIELATTAAMDGVTYHDRKNGVEYATHTFTEDGEAVVLELVDAGVYEVEWERMSTDFPTGRGYTERWNSFISIQCQT